MFQLQLQKCVSGQAIFATEVTPNRGLTPYPASCAKSAHRPNPQFRPTSSVRICVKVWECTYPFSRELFFCVHCSAEKEEKGGPTVFLKLRFPVLYWGIHFFRFGKDFTTKIPRCFLETHSPAATCIIIPPNTSTPAHL